MNHRFGMTALLLAAIGFLTTFAACATTEAPKDTTMNYWDKKKGDCDAVLSMPHAYSLTQITHCTKMWEMYRYVDNIPLKERSMYAIAFSTVSHKSTDPYDRGVADAALARICIPRHPMGSNGQIREEIPDKLECNSSVTDISISGQGVASSNPFARIKGTVEVEEVSDKDAKKARDLYKKATAQRKKKALGKAISLYKDALEANPFDVSAKYDLACAYAVDGDERAALRHLEELYTWDDPDAERRLVKARTDEDFEGIRDNANFKLLTGYVRVALVNGASALGEPTVAAMKKKLEKNDVAIAEIGKSNRVELQPQIWYREGFEDYAYQIKEILGQSKMTVNVMRNVATPNDVLVVWGQPEAAQYAVGQSAPVVQGKRAQGSDNKLDDFVKGVEDAKKSVDNAADVGSSLTENPFK